jgi:hypothetical protein
MMNNTSLEANLKAAQSAVQEMIKWWGLWKTATTDEEQIDSIAAYAAAYTSCKVYIENYLRQLYPIEKKMPMKVAQDVRSIVDDMDTIENVNDKVLRKALKDIEQLSRDAA